MDLVCEAWLPQPQQPPALLCAGGTLPVHVPATAGFDFERAWSRRPDPRIAHLCPWHPAHVQVWQEVLRQIA